MSKKYPDILAVDPETCGCTECIIGEYVPLRNWYSDATAEDVIAFIKGEVRNNTYDRLLDIIQPYNFSDESAKRFCESFVEHINDEIPNMSFTALENRYTNADEWY